MILVTFCCAAQVRLRWSINPRQTDSIKYEPKQTTLNTQTVLQQISTHTKHKHTRMFVFKIFFIIDVYNFFLSLIFFGAYYNRLERFAREKNSSLLYPYAIFFLRKRSAVIMVRWFGKLLFRQERHHAFEWDRHDPRRWHHVEPCGRERTPTLEDLHLVNKCFQFLW